MKPMRTIILCLAVLLMASSCRNGGIRNPLSVGSVGAPWEVLVVMDKAQWNAPEGRALYEVLDRDMPGLPQSEPMFQISRCDVADFTGILKPVRNIVQVEISNIYSAPKIHYYNDLWATNQAVLKLVAPDADQFIRFLQQYDQLIYAFFEEEEMKRNLHYLRKTHDRDMSRLVYEQFGIRMMVPKEMKHYKLGKDFIWLSNSNHRKRQSIVLYTYPYTDANTFTKSYLLAKRDSVMKVNIPGGPEGSYMARQEKETTFFRELNLNGKYAAELRGLWEVRGDIMGGPYVSLTRLDEQNQRIVTLEVFLYAPDDNKRNLLRHNESAIFSAKLPGETNQTD